MQLTRTFWQMTFPADAVDSGLDMSERFQAGLDLTIRYLETLKARGVTRVLVSAQLLEELKRGGQPAVHSTAPRHIPAAGTKPHVPGVHLAGRATIAPVQAGTSEPVGASTAAVQQRAAGEPLFRYQSEPGLMFDASSPGLKRQSPEEKSAAFEELRKRVLACTKCPHLARTRKNVVFGVGNINAELMFVGEAPGVEEDEQGEPFVGKAGQLLTKIIQAMGLTREKVYIGNVLKCRPDTPPGVPGNRKPTYEEMQTCVPYLHEQIFLIGPKVIVALGATAVEGMFNKRNIQITKIRGHWLEWNGIPVMPTYHPSYLLRNPAVTVKREVWEDMLAVMERLGMPISEKQRNYFRTR